MQKENKDLDENLEKDVANEETTGRIEKRIQVTGCKSTGCGRGKAGCIRQE